MLWPTLGVHLDWERTAVVVGSVFRSVWLAVGPLVGVLVGAYIANRNQRKHWIADNKRAEYRKLLSTLASTFTGIIELRAPGVALGPAEQRKILNLEVRAGAVIMDRLFIAEEIEKMNLLVRWNHALREYDKTLNSDAFGAAFSPIPDDLRRAAGKIIEKK